MKARSGIAALGVAALIGGTGAMVVPAIASAHTTSHTLTFTSVTERSVDLSKTSNAQQDRDVVKGKVIGFDELYSTFNPKTGSAKGNVALDIKGGILYGTLSFGPSAAVTGRVTGGTGKFKGARGTIKGVNLNKSGTRTAVTIVWH